LINRDYVDPQSFPAMRLLDVSPGEPSSANGLLIGERLIYPCNFPNTCRVLEASGIALELVDISELAKAEAAVTCCSIVFRSSASVG
jgi:dimethylargininase